MINPKFYKIITAITVIVALYLRFGFLETFGTFGHDNSRDLIKIMKLIDFGELIYRGPVFSLVWGFVSPLYYYTVLPFYYMFGMHPLSPSITTMIFNALGLFVIIWLMPKIAGRKATLIALVIYGLSFQLIQQGGKGLNPSLMPPFAFLWIFSLVKVFLEGETRFLFWLSISSAFLLSYHPAGVFSVPVTLVFFIKGYKYLKWNRKAIFNFTVPFLFLGVFPYLVQEKKFNWWTFRKLIEHFQSETGDGLSFFQSKYNFIIILVKNIALVLDGNLGYVSLMVGLVLMVSLLFSIAGMFSDKLQFVSIVILLYVGFLGLAITFKNSDPYTGWFFAMFIPLMILYTGMLLNRLKNTGLIVLMGFFAVYNIHQVIVYQGQENTYGSQLQIANIIKLKIGSEDFDMYNVSQQPINYLLWYNEKMPDAKMRYYSWLNWDKRKINQNVFLITDSYNIIASANKYGLDSRPQSWIQLEELVSGRNLFKLK